MNQVFLSDSTWVHFGTSSATTGAATNADSTPTVVVAEDGTDMGYAPTVTNVATGLYKVEIAATAGNGFEAGRRYSVYAVATVGGITGRDGIGEFEVLAVDLNTGVASVSGLTAANLDVAVSTRMATYVQPAGFLAATFPLTVASTTNITGGTITTVSGNVEGNVNGSVGSVVGAVGSVTAAVTVGTINADVITAASIAAGAIGASEAPLLANLDVAVSTRLATAGYTAPLDAAGTRTAIGLAAANLDTQLDALPTAAEIVAAQLTTAITEAYRANGAAPTLAQFMSEVLAHLGEMDITGTTKTINKLDHATAAATFTLNDATAPTAITRAT